MVFGYNNTIVVDLFGTVVFCGVYLFMHTNVRISPEILDRVRSIVKNSKPRVTLVSYVDAALEIQLKKDEAKKARKK